MGEAAPKKYYSVEEYLEMETYSLEKHEYYDGEIFAMAGGTLDHSLLCNNMGIVLGNALRKKNKPCRVYNSDLKIAVSERKFLYPDASVVCGKAEQYSNMPHAVKNPILIVEVLSESTALYDREDKFQSYQTIASFQEYVLISQDKILVEVFFKELGTNFWQYRTNKNLNDTIVLKSIDVEILLEELYLGWESKA